MVARLSGRNLNMLREAVLRSKTTHEASSKLKFGRGSVSVTVATGLSKVKMKLVATDYLLTAFRALALNFAKRCP